MIPELIAAVGFSIFWVPALFRLVFKRKASVLQLILAFWTLQHTIGPFVTIYFGGSHHIENTAYKFEVYLSLYLFYFGIFAADLIMRRIRSSESCDHDLSMAARLGRNPSLKEFFPLFAFAVGVKVFMYIVHGKALIVGLGTEALQMDYFSVVLSFVGRSAELFSGIIAVTAVLFATRKKDFVLWGSIAGVFLIVRLLEGRGIFLLTILLSTIIFIVGSHRSPWKRLIQVGALGAAVVIFVFPVLLEFRNIIRYESQRTEESSFGLFEFAFDQMEGGSVDTERMNETNFGHYGRLYLLTWNQTVAEGVSQNGAPLFGAATLNEFMSFLPRLLRGGLKYEGDYFIQLKLGLARLGDDYTNIPAVFYADFMIWGIFPMAVIFGIMLNVVLWFGRRFGRFSDLAAAGTVILVTLPVLSFEASLGSVMLSIRNAILLSVFLWLLAKYAKIGRKALGNTELGPHMPPNRGVTYR